MATEVKLRFPNRFTCRSTFLTCTLCPYPSFADKVDVLGEEQPSARAKRHLVRLASDADKARLGGAFTTLD